VAAGFVGFGRRGFSDHYGLWVENRAGDHLAFTSSDPQVVLRIRDAVTRTIVNRTAAAPENPARRL